MALKIKSEIQISYRSYLEGKIIHDIAKDVLGYRIADYSESHFRPATLGAHAGSRSVRFRLLDGEMKLVHQSQYRGIKLNFEEFIEYALKAMEGSY